MAVPKKKRSKAKKRTHKSLWKRKASYEAEKALSLGKSILSGRSTFVYPSDEEEDDNEE
jgi:large subunit ribosomal protein L32